MRRGLSRAALPLPTASEAAFETLLAAFGADAAEPSVATPAERTEPAHATTPECVASAPSPPTALTASALRGPEPPVLSASPPPTPAPSGAAVGGGAVDTRTFLRDLYAKRNDYLSREPFASIGRAAQFHTKVVGVSFEGRQAVVGGLRDGVAVDLVREPQNPHDPSAIAVRYGALQLGFLRREIAARLAPIIDGGERYVARVASITGGGERHTGVNLDVRRERAAAVEGSRAARGAPGYDPTAADAYRLAVRTALIGDRPLRESQRAVLERVEAGRHTLAVLGTGRGKSFCFQYPAAVRALERGEKTLVFYPLRALANDQFDALRRRLGPLGLRILRANGALDGDERAELDLALDDGAWDIVLATPEYALFHRDAFERACNRPGLVVVDEAHHIFESKHRPAYGKLGELIRGLGAPQVLALTATARADAFREIRRALDIDAWVVDPTVRENLHLVDARNTTDKYAYVRAVAGMPGKTIVYCNSRAEATKVAEKLRGEFSSAVAFYHAGVPALERAMVEDLFRRGELETIVATSAFGEGIDLPDVRDVVLYHLNFDFTEFNQQAGRAGRDGDVARIHLLYGEADRRINDFIIGKNAPSVALLREIYRGVRGIASEDVVRLGFEEIARTLELDMVEGSTVATAVRIFEEGGLVRVGVDDDGRFVRFLPSPKRVDLTQTTRFAEGQAERDTFERFCELALKANAIDLEAIVNRPIYPDGVPQLRPD